MTHISEIVDRIMPYLDKEAIWREVAKRLVDGDPFDDSVLDDPYVRIFRVTDPNEVMPIPESPQDQFDRFISECCELGDDHAASSRELWDAYLAWAEPSSDPDCGLSWTMFSRMVSQLDGVAKFKNKKLGGRMAFRGIGLKEQAE